MPEIKSLEDFDAKLFDLAKGHLSDMKHRGSTMNSTSTELLLSLTTGDNRQGIDIMKMLPPPDLESDAGTLPSARSGGTEPPTLDSKSATEMARMAHGRNPSSPAELFV